VLTIPMQGDGPSASPQGGGWSGAALRPRLEFAAKAFVVTSFVGALAAGALRMSDKAHASPAHRIDLSRWTVLDRPAWTTLDDVRAVRAGSGLAAYKSSFYDVAALGTLEGYLAKPPIVKRVAGVRRVWPNRVEAVLELRRPVVAVLVPGTTPVFVETDAEGVALGGPTAARPSREGGPLRLVVGAAGAAPAPGGRFGPDVVAAASLAASLDSYSEDDAELAWLDRIDVSNYGARLRPGASEILLAPSPPAALPGQPAPKPSKCVVEWGRAGDREADGRESPFHAKAARLSQALKLFPRLEGLRSVRVAFADLVVVPDGKDAPAPLRRALEIDGGVKPK
jgi:hypothetical protein